jgi:hypothetical protein
MADAAGGRYAVILKETGEVIDIKIMEGAAPELNADKAHLYDVEQVDAGVLIGMVRGGPNDSAGAFGFPEGESIGDRYGSAATKLKQPTEDETGTPSSHEKVRAGEERAKDSEPAKKASKPTGKAKKAA